MNEILAALLFEGTAPNMGSAPGVVAAPSADPTAVNHAVRFYEGVPELAQAVAEYAGPGLNAGDGAVIIATQPHRVAFLRALAARGVDTEAAAAAGRLILADADELLARFVRDGRAEREAFRDIALSLLARFPAGTPIHAYGEMVDVLWQRGDKHAALQLEQWWTELQSVHGFSLLCAYAMAGFDDAPAEIRDVCTAHSHVERQLPNSAPRKKPFPDRMFVEHAREFAGEVGRRMEVEAALRVSLAELRAAEARLMRSQRELLAVTNSLPTLVCHVDAELRYTFLNVAYERWFGVRSVDLVGKHVRDVVGEDAFAVIGEHMAAALSGRAVVFEAHVPYRLGGERFIEANYVPRLEADGRVCGFVGLIADITERKRSEREREHAAQRAERLMKVTAAIADAVTPEQVYDAIVDQVAVALDASSAALWRIAEDGCNAALLRSVGYSAAAQQHFEQLALDAAASSPAIDAIASGLPVWIDSQADLLERYPQLMQDVTHGKNYRVACLPVTVRDRPLGVLGFTLEGDHPLDADERTFLRLIARYSGQALERLRLLEAEQRSRSQAELLYQLAASANGAERVEQVFDAALDAIERALGASRSSILAFDPDGVMRFKAWRGLSAEYRSAVEGHSPWSRDTRSPAPVLIADAEREPSVAQYLPLFRAEGIAALGFIPLVAAGRLIGKFMVYYERPRALAAYELELATAIANHVASAIDRFAMIGELQRTVHFNEMFTGMLGHDLRNPLAAIMTAAQLVITRGESERVVRPLARIVASGTRMARMIDQLLDFTRVRVGEGIPLERRRCDLAPLLQLVVDELRDAYPAAQLELESCGDQVGTWDADRLLQVFSNLGANAVQHGLPGHGVLVSVDGRAEQHVIVRVHNMGAIADGLVPRLFEPMAGSERRRDRSQGLGLGLFISREIAIAHGGTIDVCSSHEEGTTFAVSLPRGSADGRG